MKSTVKTVIEFLKESNAIEGVFDEISLKQAQTAWDFLISKKTLTIGTILKTHKILMLHQNLQPDEKGYFRRCPIYIGGRQGINWVKIPLEIEDWLGDIKVSIKIPGVDGYHIKLDHIEYERIHPFVDGNGRTGRMFYNWQRCKAGLPIHVIHTGKEQTDYYSWFK